MANMTNSKAGAIEYKMTELMAEELLKTRNKEKIEIKLKKFTYTSPQLFNNNILCVTRDYINKEIKPKELKRTCPCHRHLDSSKYSTGYQKQQGYK